ncbi:MAG: hypothetical protein CSA68_09500 [Rhodobacterales bacterium]|nr:MAG: hypothetical protein CSA68_09500 [Rhodobacterales bacterium]
MVTLFTLAQANRLTQSLTRLPMFSSFRNALITSYAIALGLATTGWADSQTTAPLPMPDCTVKGKPGFQILTECVAADETVLVLNRPHLAEAFPFNTLTSLDKPLMGYPSISDLSRLSDLTALRWLDLRDAPVTDLSPLKGLPNLNSLITPDGKNHSSRTEAEAAIAAHSPRP